MVAIQTMAVPLRLVDRLDWHWETPWLHANGRVWVRQEAVVYYRCVDAQSNEAQAYCLRLQDPAYCRAEQDILTDYLQERIEVMKKFEQLAPKERFVIQKPPPLTSAAAAPKAAPITPGLNIAQKPPVYFSPEMFIGERVTVLGIPGRGKALALDTPLATPSGWTTMGDVKVGDWLFDEKGCPCLVTFISDIQTDHPCYRVEFSDGTHIVADAEHVWLSHTYRSRLADGNAKAKKAKQRGRGGRPQCERKSFPQLVTTEQMLNTLNVGSGTSNSRKNHAILCAAPIDLPAVEEVDLPIPPYVLGAWLGDGATAAGCITNADPEILDQIRLEGYFVAGAYKGSESGKSAVYRIGQNQYGVTFHEQLRLAGLLNNKHIPAIYLRGSIEQRLALLQGLMDTDGTISRDCNGCTFTNTIKSIVDGVAELVVSLGWIAKRRDRLGKLNGVEHKRSYEVGFRPMQQVFRLTRKANRFNPDVGQETRYKQRYVTAIEPVESVPVKCVQVNSASHLYLAGRSMIPTHNTNTVAVVVEETIPASGMTIIDIEGEYYTIAERYPALIVGKSPRSHVDVPIMNAALLADLAYDGLRVILDLSYHEEEDCFEFLEVYLERLWERAIRGKRPHNIILEEAHTFIPQTQNNPVKALFKRIATRGRKRGLGLIVVSQRSTLVDKNVLTLSGVYFLHQVLHPKDMQVYKDLIPLKPNEVEAMVRGLSAGECVLYLSGQVPKVVSIRKRHTTHVSNTPGLLVENESTIPLLAPPELEQLIERLGTGRASSRAELASPQIAALQTKNVLLQRRITELEEELKAKPEAVKVAAEED